MNKGKSLFNHIKNIFGGESVNVFFKVSLLFLLSMLLMRCSFFVQLFIRQGLSVSACPIILSGIVFDGVLLLEIIAWIFIPFCVLYYYCPRTAARIYLVIIGLYILLTAALNEYFCTTMRPLDHILCMYSAAEIKSIVFSSTTMSVHTILLFVFAGLLIIGVVTITEGMVKRSLLKPKTDSILKSSIYVIILIVVFSFDYSSLVKKGSWYNNIAYDHLAINQLSNMVQKVYDYRTKDVDMGFDLQYSKEYRDMNPHKNFVDLQYPFYHLCSDEDVLGDLLQPTSDGQLPNFVFVIVESMGQHYTGEPEPSVPLMPFVESLKDSGLYWKNCLSTAERTFAAVPSIFASAPHGTHGFANQWHPIPSHNSLLKDLAANGYTISFYYGGSNAFDGQNNFLNSNKISYILDAQLDSTLPYYEKLKDNNRWGLDDGDTYQLALKHKQANDKKPFVDIYQTLSTHEPFLVPDMEHYRQLVKNEIQTTHFKSDLEKENVKRNIDVFASFLYADDCLKELINAYRQRPDYENTIFILVGDHRMVPIGNSNPLQKYHVPLVIFSPLVKSPKTMNAVVSHLDITPTINAYLKNNYPYKTDAYCHWLGNSLDTSTAFVSKQQVAFMLNNRDMEDYLHGDYVCSKGRLYKIDSALQCNMVRNDTLLSQMEHELSTMRALFEYTCNHDFLLKEYSRNAACVWRQSIAKSITLHPDDEFGMVCDKFTLEKNVNFLHLVVSMEATCNKNVYPQIVVSLKKDGQQIYYNNIDIQPVAGKGKKIKHFQLKNTYYIGKNTQGAEVNIYLWNHQKVDFTYSHVDVKVIAEIDDE